MARCGARGLPGGGKTTLLIQLANDPDIRNQFPDGILWGSLGRNPNLAALAQAWCMAMRVAPARLSQAAGIADKIKLLHDAIAHCHVLIIVDDVWNADDALPMTVTRNKNLAAKTLQIQVSINMVTSISYNVLWIEEHAHTAEIMDGIA